MGSNPTPSVLENNQKKSKCAFGKQKDFFIGKTKLALKDYERTLLDFKNHKELARTDKIEKLIKTCEENLRSNQQVNLEKIY